MKKNYKKIIFILFLFALSGWIDHANAQYEMLDSTFDVDGMVTTDISTDADMISSIAIQSDGKIVAAGNAKIAGVTQFAVLRYNSDGSLDNTFGTGGIVTTVIGTFSGASAVAIQSDGKIVVAGYALTTDADFTVVRYDTNGTLDLTFDADGIASATVGISYDIPRDMVIQTDGKIVLAGYAKIGTVSNFGLARFNTDGSLDNTFDTDGVLITVFGSGLSDAFSVAIQPDNKIVAAGINDLGSNTDFAVARYNTDGSLDITFDTDGKLSTDISADGDIGAGVVIQADGKILVTGEVDEDLEEENFALLRYNMDGTLDNTFGTGGIATTDFFGDNDNPNCLVLQPDGKIIVAGYTFDGISFPDFALARYLTTGGLDNSFGTGGKLWTDFGTGTNIVGSVALQADGKIVAGGGSNIGGVTTDFALSRYHPNGAVGIVGLSSTANSFHVYPNPGTGRFQFAVDNLQLRNNFEIEISNVMGEKVLHLQNTREIDLSNAPKGIYYAKISDGTNFYSGKIVVQ